MSFDKTKPAGSTPLKQSDDQLRDNFAALETAIGQDHDFTTGSTQTGEHKQVLFNAPLATKPTVTGDKAAVYVKTVSGKSELFFEDEDGNEVQLTTGGKLRGILHTWKIGSVAVSNGSNAVTGVGFKPAFVILFGQSSATYHKGFSIGVDDGTNRFCVYVNEYTGQSGATTSWGCYMRASSGTYDQNVKITAKGSDGFTLSATESEAIYYIAVPEAS